MLHAIYFILFAVLIHNTTAFYEPFFSLSTQKPILLMPLTTSFQNYANEINHQIHK